MSEILRAKVLIVNKTDLFTFDLYFDDFSRQSVSIGHHFRIKIFK